MAENNFVGYEYHEIATKRSMASVYTDGYENFGWHLDDTTNQVGKIDSIVMRFKRNRKIRNKAELTSLQRQFEVGISEIISLEASKHYVAAITAYTVGIIGTAFMAGAVFSVTSNMIILCIILAIPAFIGWILPYFLYKSMEKKKSAAVTPLIEEKYDELYMVCEKANRLLDHIGN